MLSASATNPVNAPPTAPAPVKNVVPAKFSPKLLNPLSPEKKIATPAVKPIPVPPAKLSIKFNPFFLTLILTIFFALNI